MNWQIADVIISTILATCVGFLMLLFIIVKCIERNEERKYQKELELKDLIKKEIERYMEINKWEQEI